MSVATAHGFKAQAGKLGRVNKPHTRRAVGRSNLKRAGAARRLNLEVVGRELRLGDVCERATRTRAVTQVEREM
jgi:hypothetical protein